MRDKIYAKKFINRYLYSQAYRKEGWVDKQVKTERMNLNMANTLKMIIPVLESVYPGQWDIQFQLDYGVRAITNQYSLFFYDEVWYDYLLDKYGRTILNEEGRRERIPCTEEEFEAQLDNDWRLKRSVLRDCYHPEINIDFLAIDYFEFQSFRVIIHFPEVTVRNSRSQSITIKDLFFRFYFDKDGTLSEELQGSKTTFTTDEFESGYIHSHIPTMMMYGLDSSQMNRTRIPFQKVCLGAGEMKPLMLNFKLDPTTEDFQMVLLMLKTVASWESIEGVPHHRMENVITKQIGAPSIHWHNSDQVFKYLLNSKSIQRGEHTIDWYYSNGQYRIIDNEKFEDFCLAAYGYERIPFDYIVHKDETGAYYIPNQITPTDIEPTEHDYILFKGEQFFLKVEGELRLSGKRKKYINPNIKNYVKFKLEQAANKIQIKADSISRLHKVNNNQGVSRQSEIPM